MCVVASRLLECVCVREQGREPRDIYREMLQEPHLCPLSEVGEPLLRMGQGRTHSHFTNNVSGPMSPYTDKPCTLDDLSS